MIFTGQAWNMTFSLYHSLKSVPADLQEAASLYRFNWWRRFTWVELPFGTTALAWNSMMSMAGGWFFLMINESFVLGGHDFRLPGLGSYMSVAAEQGNVKAMVAGVVAMIVMITALDQVLWRPVIVWAQRFRIEETAGGEAPRSWFLGAAAPIAPASPHRGLAAASRPTRGPSHEDGRPPVLPNAAPQTPGLLRSGATVALVVLGAAMLYGSARLAQLLWQLPPGSWGTLLGAAGVTLARVLLSTVLGTLWTVPVGLAIGLSPRLSRLLQPVVQVVASFPAPMLFPAVIALLHLLGVGLGWGSVLLMLLGTQWYILFNVVAGASSVPSDLRETARSFGLGRWQRLWSLYIPATFPYLVTGWVTAAGGAWNATIVAEYVTHRGEILKTFGLGAVISEAATHADFSHPCGRGAADVRRGRDLQPARLAPDLPAGPDTLLAHEVRDAMEDESVLCELRGVQKWFDRGTGKPLRVLEDINLELRPNEVVCLIGPSGLWQVHDPADLRRPHQGEQGRGPLPRREARRADAGRRHRLPGLRALPLDDRRSETWRRCCAPATCRTPRRPPAHVRRSGWSASRASSAPIRASSRVA